MEISILLTLLFMTISLGRLCFQVAKISPIVGKKINLDICSSHEVEKLVMRVFYLLNIVVFSDGLKATQKTPIQSQKINIEG